MLVGDAITFTVPKQKREPREPSPSVCTGEFFRDQFTPPLTWRVVLAMVLLPVTVVPWQRSQGMV